MINVCWDQLVGPGTYCCYVWVTCAAQQDLKEVSCPEHLPAPTATEEQMSSDSVLAIGKLLDLLWSSQEFLNHSCIGYNTAATTGGVALCVCACVRAFPDFIGNGGGGGDNHFATTLATATQAGPTSCQCHTSEATLTSFSPSPAQNANLPDTMCFGNCSSKGGCLRGSEGPKGNASCFQQLNVLHGSFPGQRNAGEHLTHKCQLKEDFPTRGR